MQNNLLLKGLHSDIIKSHYILILIPKNTNIDIVCSSLALSNYFFENKIKHKVVCLSKSLPNKLDYLSRFDKMTSNNPKYYDLLINMDCAEFNNQTKSISEIVYEFFTAHDLFISKNTAECLYTGLYDNSSGFINNINSGIFDVLSNLLKCGINAENISNNLLKRESLAKFKCTTKIMNTLELYDEGKLACVYLENNWTNETGINNCDCDDVLDKVSCIGIVDIALYFRMDKNKILVFLTGNNSSKIAYIIKNLDDIEVINSSTLLVNSSNLFKTKEKVVNSILNYI